MNASKRNVWMIVLVEIVRTLVCMLFSRYGKPDRSHCGAMARQLILKYPFMKDRGMGCAYVSQKIYNYNSHVH